MGVGVLPRCTGILSYICVPFNFITREVVYSALVQNNVGPAGYFRDPYDYKGYVNGATFLPDLNNQKNGSLAEIKERYEGLEKMLLIKFEDDTMIIPKETAWFGF